MDFNTLRNDIIKYKKALSINDLEVLDEIWSSIEFNYKQKEKKSYENDYNTLKLVDSELLPMFEEIANTIPINGFSVKGITLVHRERLSSFINDINKLYKVNYYFYSLGLIKSIKRESQLDKEIRTFYNQVLIKIPDRKMSVWLALLNDKFGLADLPSVLILISKIMSITHCDVVDIDIIKNAENYCENIIQFYDYVRSVEQNENNIDSNISIDISNPIVSPEFYKNNIPLEEFVISIFQNEKNKSTKFNPDVSHVKLSLLIYLYFRSLVKYDKNNYEQNNADFVTLITGLNASEETELNPYDPNDLKYTKDKEVKKNLEALIKIVHTKNYDLTRNTLENEKRSQKQNVDSSQKKFKGFSLTKRNKKELNSIDPHHENIIFVKEFIENLSDDEMKENIKAQLKELVENPTDFFFHDKDNIK
jgi:hypothetical protein